jgi:hypothetical protein
MITKLLSLLVVLASLAVFASSLVFADGLAPGPAGQADTRITNPNQTGFKLVPCDGPQIANPPPGYVVCDFNAFVFGIQKVISAALWLAVPFAIILLGWNIFQYFTNSDTPGMLAMIKGRIFAIAAGLALILFSWIIVYSVLQFVLSPNAQGTPGYILLKRQ